MKIATTLGAILLTGGCAGVRAGVSWPGSAVRGQEAAVSLSQEESMRIGIADQPSTPIDRVRRFKSEDGSMRFENTPLETPRGKPNMISEVSCPRLPKSLMDPWRSIGSSDPLSSPLFWSRGIPGVTENGFNGAHSGWSK
jgi:hypothetical protein